MKLATIIAFVVVEASLAIFVHWTTALALLPFLLYHGIKRKAWIPDERKPSESVNRNYRLPLSRVHVPRMRMK